MSSTILDFVNSDLNAENFIPKKYVTIKIVRINVQTGILNHVETKRNVNFSRRISANSVIMLLKKKMMKFKKKQKFQMINLKSL